MARAGRGHPQMNLWRIVFADFVLGLGAGALFALGIVPFSVAQMIGAAWYWQLAAAMAGFAAIAVIIMLARRLAPRFDRQILWTRETYERAKARSDLPPWQRLSGLAQGIAATLIGIVIFVLVVPILPLMLWAFRSQAWMDSWIGATVVFLPMPLYCALLAISFRLSTYAAFHLARRLNGSPVR